jgi:hypothetical protein
MKKSKIRRNFHLRTIRLAMPWDPMRAHPGFAYLLVTEPPGAGRLSPSAGGAYTYAFRARGFR